VWGDHAGCMSIVQVSGLRKSYGDKVVVHDVSFAVQEGEIFGILGPNGAGKTTAVECLEGLRVPDAGEIRVAGLDPQRDHSALTEVLGVQLQSSELQPKMTVVEALELYSAFYRDPLDWRVLSDQLSLGSVLHQRFGKLSGGQRQRLFIALALVGRPRVVVFDELTTALDPWPPPTNAAHSPNRPGRLAATTARFPPLRPRRRAPPARCRAGLVMVGRSRRARCTALVPTTGSTGRSRARR